MLISLYIYIGYQNIEFKPNSYCPLPFFFVFLNYFLSLIFVSNFSKMWREVINISELDKILSHTYPNLLSPIIRSIKNLKINFYITFVIDFP